MLCVIVKANITLSTKCKLRPFNKEVVWLITTDFSKAIGFNSTDKTNLFSN